MITTITITITMSSELDQYVYQPLNNNNYSYQVSDSGYYLHNQPTMMHNATSELPNVQIDITAKNRLAVAYFLAIAMFGFMSMMFTSLIFTFSYLWYAITQEHENLVIASISGIGAMSIGLLFFTILFVIAHKQCKSLYRLVLDQGVFLH